jgi:hypothetical protein
MGLRSKKNHTSFLNDQRALFIPKALNFEPETSEKLLVQYFLPEQESLESAVIAG